MRNLILICITAFIVSCSTAKRTETALNSGNYNNAINTSITKLAGNKTKKSNQKYVYMLEDAFAKNTKRELKEINFLEKEGNAANLEKIYNRYVNLDRIQKRIEPLLPLQIYEEGRNASLAFTNYNDKLLTSKSKLSEYLYDNAANLMTNATTKFDYRNAYSDFVYLNQLSPNFKDTKEKIEESYEKGKDYVRVGIFNESQTVLPEDLEADILNFNAYDLNDKWTTYHTNPLKGISYNYEMQIAFKSILISPEQIRTNVDIKEKEIKDGWKYVLDQNGNVAKDSLGNDLKEDKFITVKCRVYKNNQFKDVQINGNVIYVDLNTEQQINSYPLTSGFVFDHSFGTYKGDKRALEEADNKLIALREVPFPSNEQMIYDSAQQLKNAIKGIVTQYKFN